MVVGTSIDVNGSATNHILQRNVLLYFPKTLPLHGNL